MGKTLFETIIGAVVLLVAGYFLITAYMSGSSKDIDGYSLYATFDRVDGLKEGGDVRMSGLPVGKITQMSVLSDTFQARVDFAIQEGVKVPKDSTAEIIGDGLLGNKYLSLVPGGSDEMLVAGNRIRHTQSAISLESLIGKFVFGSSDAEDEGGEPTPAAGNVSGADKSLKQEYEELF